MPARFSKIGNDIYRGGKPSEQDLFDLKNKYHINRVISLDLETGIKIHPILIQLKIEHILFPISPWEVNIKKLNILKNNIIAWMTDTTPSYIHCYAGKDRTGLAVALFRILHDNWDPKKALAEAKSFGFGIGLDKDVKNSFIKFILNSNNIANDNSVVDESRINLENPAPAINLQQSFAPFEADPTIMRPISRSRMMMDVLDNLGYSDKDSMAVDDMPLVGRYQVPYSNNLSTEVSSFRSVPDVTITTEKWDDGVNVL